ncbi:MAG: radical SAM family heme chaperone HemW [Bacteroidales bacterium]|nr:radical SAM family heme chaperone HemW [Bacteroidales bacterium]
MAGIYIHVPFCSRFCNYCDFYSVKQTGRIGAYVESLLCEIEQRRDFFNNCNAKPTTLYIGGGTPSLLSNEQISRITEKVCSCFNIHSPQQFREFTVEVNPDDVTSDYLSALHLTGVNRLSMGIQSFDDDDLRWMNRRHDSAMAKEAYSTARHCGFDNISLDLIFGYNLLSEDKWIRNVETMISLKPEHISSYQLGIEKNTKLGAQFASGEYIPLPEDRSYLQYSILQRMLAGAGYIQYEISNFALPGFEAIHNSSYWDYSPYLGLGPSAHSFDGNKRSWNCSNIGKYISALQCGDSCSESELLTLNDKFNERVMLSLRKAEGLDIKAIKEMFPADDYNLFVRQLKFSLEKGLVIEDGNKIKIPSDKLFISDGIIRDLFI